MQVLTGAGVHRFLCDQVIGPHLFPQQPRHAIDDFVAGGVAERVVVPLE